MENHEQLVSADYIKRVIQLVRQPNSSTAEADLAMLIWKRLLSHKWELPEDS